MFAFLIQGSAAFGLACADSDEDGRGKVLQNLSRPMQEAPFWNS